MKIIFSCVLGDDLLHSDVLLTYCRCCAVDVVVVFAHVLCFFVCIYTCARLFITAVQKATKDGFINGTVVWRTHTHTHMIPLLKVTPTCHQSDDWHLRQPIMECERSWLFMNKTLADWLVIWFKGYLAFFSCRLLLADSYCGVKCRAIMSECVFIQTPHPNTRKKHSKCQLIPVPRPLEFGPSPVTTEETFLCRSLFKYLCNPDESEAATHFDNKSSFRFSLSRAREASCFERWTVKVKPRAEVREGM